MGVNQNHYFEACELTDRFTHDDQLVKPLLAQIHEPIDHFSGDGAYDESPIYDALITHSPNVDVVIPPRSNAVLNDHSAAMRNRNIQEIDAIGRMAWQKERQYGRRNLRPRKKFQIVKWTMDCRALFWLAQLAKKAQQRLRVL